MILFVAFAALAVVSLTATAIGLSRDGYRARPTDPSRIPDRSPASAVDIERPAHPRPVRSRRVPQGGVRVRARA
jgi:hypothetical protein